MKVSEVACFRDGEMIGTNSMRNWINEIGIDDTTAYKMVQTGWTVMRNGHDYQLEYTGEKIEARGSGRYAGHAEEFRKTKKPERSISDVDLAAKKAGMSYGQYVARMGI